MRPLEVGSASTLEIRPYAPGDEQEILKLFAASFGRELDADVWKWRFIDNPSDPGRMFIHLMWDGPVLAGHYAVSPVRMNISGQIRLTALSMTTMTHPDYAGRGVFTTLAESVYNELQRSGYYMVWGFPNHNSHYGFIRRLDWTDVYQVPMLRLTRKAVRRAPSSSTRVHEIWRFDDDVDELVAGALDAEKVWVVRDKDYLTWRYLLEPSQKYTAFGLRESGRLRGYMITKLYWNGPQLEGDIVDLLAVHDEAVWDELLSHAIHDLLEKDVAAINTWFNPYYSSHLLLERWGFRLTAPVTWLGARVFGRKNAFDVLEYRDWYITMGDSDVF